MRASNSDKEAGGKKRGGSVFFEKDLPLTKVPGQDWRERSQGDWSAGWSNTGD